MWRLAYGTITVPLCLLASACPAGTITQTATFHYASAGTTLTQYNQLSPSLAPLNDVVFDVSIQTAGGSVFSLLNPTLSALTFNVTETTFVGTDGGSASATAVEQVTLGSGQSTFVFPPTITGAHVVGIESTGLGFLVGTSSLSPYAFVSGEVTTSNSSIQMMNDTTEFGSQLINGSETVTYYFGTTFFVPEPGSWVGMIVGIGAVAGLMWRRRLAA